MSGSILAMRAQGQFRLWNIFSKTLSPWICEGKEEKREKSSIAKEPNPSFFPNHLGPFWQEGNRPLDLLCFEHLFKVELQLVFISVMFVFYLSTLVQRKPIDILRCCPIWRCRMCLTMGVLSSYCDQRLNDTNNKCN